MRSEILTVCAIVVSCVLAISVVLNVHFVVSIEVLTKSNQSNREEIKNLAKVSQDNQQELLKLRRGVNVLIGRLRACKKMREVTEILAGLEKKGK